MKVYKGASASPGLVLGQVSRLERHVETFSDGPFNPEREQRMLDEAIHTAQTELDSMAERSAPTEQAIFLFQSTMPGMFMARAMMAAWLWPLPSEVMSPRIMPEGTLNRSVGMRTSAARITG